MRRVMSALAVLLILAGIIWAFMPRPVFVETAVLAQQKLEVSVEEEGEARIREVFTISATNGGKLQRIDVHAGDEVIADKSIVAVIGPAAPALLDSRARSVAEATRAAAQSAVDLAKAQQAQAQAALEFKTSEAKRARALFEKSAVSERLLDAAVLDQKTAQATLDSASANLAVRQRELESAEAVLQAPEANGMSTCCVELVAPVTGQILRVLTENEQVVLPGTPILEIGDPGNLEIAATLLSRDAVRVQKGAVAQITGWGGKPLAATVERIEPSATTKTSALGIDEQRVKVILSLAGDPAEWKLLGHGFRVIVRINVWKDENVLAVPVAALFRDGSDWTVFVARDGAARLQVISLGERNDDFAQVLSGLEPSERVILHPSDVIADGTSVTFGGD